MQKPGGIIVAWWTACLGVLAAADAADWPQFLGPNRNGVAGAGEAITDTLTQAGARRVWSKDVGDGYAGPAVAGGRVFFLHRRGEEDLVEAFDAKTGRSLWTHAYATDYVDPFGFDGGPRAVPTVDGGRVYVHGAQGKIHCLDAKTGKTMWMVDAAARFGSKKGFFGRVCSPLIEGNLLLVQVGGPDKEGIVAFDKTNGRKVWSATGDEAGYSSPVAATFGGRRYALFFTRAGLVALNPADGRIDFTFPWRSRMQASVNVATPVVSGDRIFLSACYQTGAALVRVAGGKPKKVWSGDEILSNHYATSVLHDGNLYGFHGRQEQSPELRCVDWKTGAVKWRRGRLGAGSVMIADGKLLVLTENGRLILAPASGKSFTPAGRAQILGRGIRAYPALSNGCFYARDEKRLVCVDVRKK